MSRFFEPCTVEELRARLLAQFPESIAECQDNRCRLERDISKVKFDWENHTGYDDEPDGRFVGFKKMPGGLSIFVVQAGGDWEYSVTFVVYWDGKYLRGYVPTNGNPWNRKTKEAWGNDDEDDEDQMDKAEAQYDEQAMIDEIVARIRPRPTQPNVV